LAAVYPYEDWILAAHHIDGYSPNTADLQTDLFEGVRAE